MQKMKIGFNNKRKIGFWAVLMIGILNSCAMYKPLPPTEIAKKFGTNPIIMIDGKIVSNEEIEEQDPAEITTATLYFNRDATKRFGKNAKDGVALYTTKSFARNIYESFFSEKSIEYAEVLKNYSHEDIQYVLNDNILNKNFEGRLSLITKKELKKIAIVDKTTLNEKYNIENKKIGVIITSKEQRNLNNSKK